MKTDHAIDAVVTWVDGSDPVHYRKKLAARHDPLNVQYNTILAGLDETRFSDNGELRYCLESIRRFAPWIRNIFLVTDNQKPRFLTPRRQRDLNVIIVDHREIFRGFAWALPTFNSLTIETMLWRIPGLSEQFLYFNDDVILLKPMLPDDFFQGRRVVLRGEWQRLERYGDGRWLLSRTANYLVKKLFNINRAMNALQQMRGAAMGGAIDRYFKSAHVPHPLHVSTFARFFESNPQALTANIGYRFRNRLQFAPTALANHLEIAQSRVDLREAHDSVMICFNRDTRKQIENKLETIGSGMANFLCAQSLEQATASHQTRLDAVLSEQVFRSDSIQCRAALSVGGVES